MSLEEKPSAEEISPISSPSNSQTPTPDISTLNSLQVLPKILQEGILFIASGPALLLQAAQPGLKNRLSQTPPTANANNNLSNDLTTTLHSTLSYIAVLVFGTPAEREALVGRLRISQPPLPSPPSPPQATLWLLATIYATATDFYQRIYGTFDYRTSEASYHEFSLLISHLGPNILPPGFWPFSRAAFWKYFDTQVDTLTVSAEAHKFANSLVSRKQGKGIGYLRPFMRVITIEMLPGRIREAYGLRSTAGTRASYKTTMVVLVASWPVLPKAWRFKSVGVYLEDGRRGLDV
ncbi:hypothetical protein BJY04DRAFT_13249 [Aspergillus karnatakaensis]|uniref:oxygenase MpaB family protein n=1 Tax=Aspergillus karnatakaensis TaxID=1810916 RepID=UPI003CCD876E